MAQTHPQFSYANEASREMSAFCPGNDAVPTCRKVDGEVTVERSETGQLPLDGLTEVTATSRKDEGESIIIVEDGGVTPILLQDHAETTECEPSQPLAEDLAVPEEDIALSIESGELC